MGPHHYAESKQVLTTHMQRTITVHHIFRMPKDRMPNKLVFGALKGLCPPGCPSSGLNDVVLRACQECHINRPYKDAQNRLLWRNKTCPLS